MRFPRFPINLISVSEQTHPRQPARSRSQRSAFALVAVLALLALLLVLVVSLASLLHVETRSNAAAKDLTFARQNALLGLEIALGQLQQYAGRDQAVTFPATTFYPKKNINDPLSAAPRQGKGPLYDDPSFGFRQFAQTSSARSYLTKVETYLTHAERVQWNNAVTNWWQAKNPHWIGIADSSLRVDAASNPNAVPVPLAAQSYETNPDTKFGEFKRDQLPVWLVSGNEKFRINQSTGEVRDNSGAVVATNNYPADYQTPDTTLPDPVDPNASGGSPEAKKVVWLVNTGSATTSNNSTDGLDGRVKARKQEIKAPAGGNSTQTIGHYAYWVGDESTKANFAVRDPYSSATPGSVEYRNRLQSPQRIGWENVKGFANATFNKNDPGLENISTSKEISLLEKNNATEIFRASKENFHSLTAFSRSLLTDPVLGGLKKDLTAYLNANQGLDDNDPIPNRSKYLNNDARFRAWSGTNTGFPNASSSGGLPTWGQIRYWYQNTASGGTIAPNKDNAPLLTYISLHCGMSYDPPTVSGGNGTLNWHWAPIVVLWNPYDVGLQTASYDLEVQVAPDLSTVYLCKTNPTLIELQRDTHAEWAERPVGPETGDPPTRQNVWSFKGTKPNPDFPDGDPLRPYWPIVKSDNPKYSPWNTAYNKDGFDIGGNGIFVQDNDYNDGTSDAFGRFYYRLGLRSEMTSLARFISRNGTRTSTSTNSTWSALGPNTPTFAVDFNPHQKHNFSPGDGNKLPVNVKLPFRITTSFAPGEAKVFSFRPNVSSPKLTPVWDPVNLPSIELSSGVETFDHPATIWFPLLEVKNGPDTASGLRFFGKLSPFNRMIPAVRLSIGGNTIMEAQQFGSENQNLSFTGKDFMDADRSDKNYDGDGTTNNLEQDPKFIDQWRPIYSRTDFYDNFQNQTRLTSSSLWYYGEQFFTPFLSPFGTIGATSGSGTQLDLHSHLAAFSRFNFAAKNFDLHPIIDRARDYFLINNRNYLGNREGLSKLSHVKSYDRNSLPYFDNKQFTGDNGYALIVYRQVGASDFYKGLTHFPIRIARRPNSEILSLGQFQQVNLSSYFWQPSFPIGNSWAGLYNDREAIAGIHSRQVGVGIYSISSASPGYRPNNSGSASWAFNDGTVVNVPDNIMLDMSYVLNENLWDRFFLSTIPNGHPQGQPLPNSRLRFTREAASNVNPSSLRQFDTSAAHLENVGALNVNSTSVEAWKALLTAFRDLTLKNTPNDSVPIARTLDPIGNAIQFTLSRGNASVSPNINMTDIGATATLKDYTRISNGLRYLNDDMIAVLAERIVDEVRLRGPFFSLSDFVNRRLIAPDGSGVPGSAWHQARTNGWATGNYSFAHSGPDSFGRALNFYLDFISPNYDPFIGLHGLTGALQRALDVSGINGGVNDPRLGWNGSGTVPIVDSSFHDVVFLPRLKNTGPLAKPEMVAPNDNWSNAQAYTNSGVGGDVNVNLPYPQPQRNRLVTEPTVRCHLDTEHLAGAPAGEAGFVLQGAPGFITQGDLLAMIGPALTSRGDTFLIRTYGDTVDRNGRLLSRAWLEAVVQRVAEPVKPAGTSDPDKYRYTDKFGRKFKVLNLRWLNPDEV